MGTRKLAGKLLLIAILLVVGSRMLTKPGEYDTEWRAALSHLPGGTSYNLDATVMTRAYGGAVFLSTILLMLKLEEVGCVLLLILSLGAGLVYNPFYTSTEWAFQMCLANMGLISALLILMDDTWIKIEAYLRRLRIRGLK